MNSALLTADAVKRANRRLYDAAAADYESIDGRRNASLIAYIREQLRSLAARHGDDVLLDLGAGSGVVARAARGVFRETISLDLSPMILAAVGHQLGNRVAADLDALPFAANCANVISCFAVLHHLYDATLLACEVARVLKPCGGFWSDHDMDSAFHRRFRAPLAVYRTLRGADRKYRRAARLDPNTYALAEIGETGVDADRVFNDFHAAGLQPVRRFHWFGLNKWTTRLFGARSYPRGFAPLLSLTALKPLDLVTNAKRASLTTGH